MLTHRREDAGRKMGASELRASESVFVVHNAWFMVHGSRESVGAVVVRTVRGRVIEGEHKR